MRAGRSAIAQALTVMSTALYCWLRLKPFARPALLSAAVPSACVSSRADACQTGASNFLPETGPQPCDLILKQTSEESRNAVLRKVSVVYHL